MTDEDRQKLCYSLRKLLNPPVNCLKAADEIERLAAIAQSNAEPVRAFAKAVLHGDYEHRAWLTEAAEAFSAGKPMPPPRGKGTQQSDAEPVGDGSLRDNIIEERTMTAEELCTNLRALSPGYSKMDGSYVDIGHEAANEIERLVDFVKSLESAADQNLKEAERLASENDWLRTALRAAQTAPNAQSDAEPVAWQWRWPDQSWPELSCGKAHAEYMRDKGAEIRPVFALPRPYAAGLIEAAEELADLMDDVVQGNYKPDTFTTQPLRKALLAAADRSGK